MIGDEHKLRIFLAAPFTGIIDKATGIVTQAWRTRLEILASALRQDGHSVFLAHEREEWGAALMTPSQCVRLDFQEMRAADLVIAILGNPISGGVHIELGWASALGKPCIISVESSMPSPLVEGLMHVGAPVVVLNGSDIVGDSRSIIDKLFGARGLRRSTPSPPTPL